MKNLYEKVKAMFDDVGKKMMNNVIRNTFILMILLAVATVVGTIVSLFANALLALCVLVGGALSIAIMPSLAYPIYAFSQLVDDVHAMRKGEVKKGEYDDLPNL